MEELPTATAWFHGTVVHGLANGREFGFPTANVQVAAEAIQHLRGVFAARVRTGGNEFSAMLYIGTRPTLALTELSIEIHLLDFQEDIYEKELDFRLIKKIRDEVRFASITALIAQLKADETAVRTVLKSFNAS